MLALDETGVLFATVNVGLSMFTFPVAAGGGVAGGGVAGGGVASAGLSEPPPPPQDASNNSAANVGAGEIG